MSGREQWVFQLGGRTQYRNVPYVTVSPDGGVCCQLCATGWMTRSQRVDHFQGLRHEINYNAVKNMEEIERSNEANRTVAARVGLMSTLDTRVESLGLSAWRNAVRAAMFDCCRGEINMHTVLQLLSQYEMKEALSLLEVAIWKAHITRNYAASESIAQEHECQFRKRDVHARDFAKQMRVSCGAQVIVPLVQAFLGKSF